MNKPLQLIRPIYRIGKDNLYILCEAGFLCQDLYWKQQRVIVFLENKMNKLEI